MQRLEKITWTWHKVCLKKDTRETWQKELTVYKKVLTNNRRLTLSAAVRHKVRQALNPNTGFHFSLSAHTSFTLYLTAGRPSRSWLYVFLAQLLPFLFCFFWKGKWRCIPFKAAITRESSRTLRLMDAFASFAFGGRWLSARWGNGGDVFTQGGVEFKGQRGSLFAVSIFTVTHTEEEHWLWQTVCVCMCVWKREREGNTQRKIPAWMGAWCHALVNRSCQKHSLYQHVTQARATLECGVG